MASNQDPKPASGNGYFFMAALFCPMLFIAVYAMLAIINMADNGQAQTSVQVFEMPSAELEELNSDELLDLRDDISPFLADPVEKKAIEKLDAASASKAAGYLVPRSIPSPAFRQRHEVSGIFS
jgi:hypothetical protein